MEAGFDSRSANGTPSVYSDFLAERLEQRRARAARPRRARHTDIGPLSRAGADDDIFLNEAEEEARNERSRLASRMAGLSATEALSIRRGNSASGRRSSMGVRSMEEKMDRLAKENFDLKMEVDHHRRNLPKLQEEIDSMRSKVKRFDRLQEDTNELWRLNDALVKELEKRDRAVEEAIDTICELEDKVGELEERRSTTSTTRPSTAHADSGYAGTETYEQAPKPSPPKRSKPPTTPQPGAQPRNTLAASAAGDRLQGVTNTQTPAPARREPNVLSLKKPSTQALRSVYLDNSQSLNGMKSFLSLLKERESVVDEEEDEVPTSPPLSALSETSLSSLYSSRKPQLTPARLAWKLAHADDRQSPSQQQDSINRVSRWIQDGQLPLSPSLARKSSRSSDRTERDVIASSPCKRPGDEEQYRSIADALAAASSRRAFDDATSPSSQYTEQPKPRKTKSTSQRQPRPTSFAGPLFSEHYPMTPDTSNTRKLRASRSTVADDRRQSINQHETPPLPTTYHAMLQSEPRLRTAPKQMRSSVELNAAFSTYLQRNSDDSAIVDDEDDEPNSNIANSPHEINLGLSPRAVVGLGVTDKPSPGHYPHSSIDDDAQSDAVRDFSADYDGFPDGQSILMGTPSRFLKHGKPPAHLRSPVFFDGSPEVPASTSATAAAKAQAQLEGHPTSPRRPKSSAGYVSARHGTPGRGGGTPNAGAAAGFDGSTTTQQQQQPRKPSLSRADTSPAFVGVTGKVGKLLRRMSGSKEKRITALRRG